MTFTPAPPVPPTLPPQPSETAIGRSTVDRSPIPRATLIAALIAGIVGAICWRIGELGIGTTITGLTVLAAVIGTAPEAFRRDERSYWVPLTVGIAGLLIVPSVLDADWVRGLCLFVAVCAGLLLFVRAHNLTGVAVAAFAPFVAPFFAVAEPFRRRSAPEAGKAGSPSAPTMSRTRRTLLIGAVSAVTLLLLLVFGALFAGADPTFGKLFDFDWNFSISGELVAALFAGLFIAWVSLTGSVLAHAQFSYPESARRRYPPVWTWAVPIGAVLALFVLFLGMQARAMFGGDDYVQRTANLSYSQYAVRGFWQLLVVTLLVILVATVAWWFIDADDARHRRAARLLLGGLCAATLLVVVSAFGRMERYINAYGATRDRVFGLYFEVFLAAVIIAIMVVGIRFDARPLVRRVILLTVFSALGLALLNPDRMIAKTNVDRAIAAPDATPKVDDWYLGSLSADAYGQLQRLPEPAKACATWRFHRRYQATHSWRSSNLSLHRVPRQQVPDQGPGDCGSFSY
ncbi:MAG: DUF4173 domain-containing protein [Gordonia sp. (in: high G+C Gram-positive bacteria)]|uniref:DUF4153 domain-containing protein n=1 Tax=Gordonia sp. (in: high G+C Gram-positive bacteria) TaxID=84139 RepID=UPI0039E47163